MSEKRTGTEQPTVKRADELETGDHIIEVAQYGQPPQPLKVLFAHPFRDGDGKPMVAVMLDAPTKIDGFSPLDLRVPVDAKFEMADEQDLAAYHDAGRRQALAATLRQLADEIVDLALPIPRYQISIGGVVDSRAELERWAEHLDVEVRMSGEIPVVDKERGGLDVHFQSAPEPEPETCPCLDQPEQEPSQEWLFTFGSGQQHDGRFVRITGTHASARARMVEVFGTAWCDQYDWRRFDELGLPAVLTELPDSEWTDGEIVAGIFAALDGPTAGIPAQRSGE